MRVPWLAVLALLALFPAPVAQSVLATAASTLFESAPFLLAASLAAASLRRRSAFAAGLAGCGCSSFPGALSIPSAVACAFAFGPAWAALRFGAAAAVVSLRRRRKQTSHRHPFKRPRPSVILELEIILPFALCGALTSAVVPLVLPTAGAWPRPAAFAAGALAGFLTAPCGLGAVALASGLHAGSPAVAAGFLSIAGIADLRTLRWNHAVPRATPHPATDLLLALAFVCAAIQHGAGLLNPRFTPILWLCAAALGMQSLRSSRRSAFGARHLAWSPILMLAAAIVGSPPPPTATATQTTLESVYPGQVIDFTGQLARDDSRATLVRYAITCCRADAAPVAIRIPPQHEPSPGTWLHAIGTLRRDNDELVLHPTRIERVTPPRDPFLYR